MSDVRVNTQERSKPAADKGAADAKPRPSAPKTVQPAEEVHTTTAAAAASDDDEEEEEEGAAHEASDGLPPAAGGRAAGRAATMADMTAGVRVLVPWSVPSRHEASGFALEWLPGVVTKVHKKKEHVSVITGGETHRLRVASLRVEE
jgi:hypothetical protein